MERTKLMKLVRLSDELNAKIAALSAASQKKENKSSRHISFANGDLVYDDNFEAVENTSAMLIKILPVVLKIASIKGFNEKLNILVNDTYVANSNIADYICDIFLLDKKVDERFISLLSRAHVSLDMIQNNTAREQLKEWNMSSMEKESSTNKTVIKENRLLRPIINPIKTSNSKLFAPNKALNTHKSKLTNVITVPKTFNQIKWEEASNSE